jgi:hypothetical protein
MRWIVSLVILMAGLLAGLTACGGPEIPTHNGYKPKEVAPWKKPKVLKLDAKLEAKASGSVSYPDMRRARWFEIELPANGQLALALEVTPPGDAVNDDFDLAFEVLDPSYRVIAKSDLEDEDARELNKKKTLVDLAPGKYLIHIYLQSRLDAADFVLRASFKSTAAADARTNFPVDVPFVPTLAMIPLQDDTPRSYKPTAPTPRRSRIATPPPPPPAATVSARIIAIQVVGGGVLITIGRGTETQAADGMKATLTGITGSFPIGNCAPRTCTALIKGATPDQLKSANGSVTLSP